MEYNGTGEGEQQAEYTEEYHTEYAEQTAEYLELIGLGLDEQVARELDELFQAGECCFHIVICLFCYVLDTVCIRVNINTLSHLTYRLRYL